MKYTQKEISSRQDDNFDSATDVWVNIPATNWIQIYSRATYRYHDSLPLSDVNVNR